MFSSTKHSFDLGRRVRKARTSRNLTVGKLAEATGLSKGFISQVENGRSNPSIESLRAIASALQLPLGLLLGEESKEESSSGAMEPGPQVAKIERMPFGQADASEVRLLQGSRHGTRLLVHLLPGSALVPRAIDGAAGSAFGLVVEGAVAFSQSPQSALLSRGDSVRWDPSRRFVFENRSGEAVLLFLEYPDSMSLPVVMDRLPLAREEIATTARRYSAEGPLRLAAMRAERHRMGGG